jgi:hypothetical protein
VHAAILVYFHLNRHVTVAGWRCGQVEGEHLEGGAQRPEVGLERIHQQSVEKKKKISGQHIKHMYD